VECVQKLSEKIPVVVCSGALRAEIELALDILGIKHLFQGIISAEDTADCKPDPEGYNKAIELLRKTVPDLKPDQTTAVEDSLAGIQAAIAAGMHVVAIPNSYPASKLQTASPTAIVPDLDGFTKWVLERV
jgi:beta-phosphoglucomutase-like phosphatase (HAD superfamily)